MGGAHTVGCGPGELEAPEALAGRAARRTLGPLGAEGLPLGVQLAGSRFSDHVTIAGAMALERATGGWVPPWGN